MEPKHNITRWLVPLIIVLCVETPLLLFVMDNSEWRVIAQVLVLTAILPFFFVDYYVSFLILLIARPALDVFSQTEFIQLGQFSLNLSSVVSLASMAWIGWYVWTHRFSQERARLITLFALFVGLSTASLLYTPSLSETLREVVRVGSIFAFFLLGTQLLTHRERFNGVIKALLTSLIIPIGVGLIQFINGSGVSFGGVDNRVYGTFGHPNGFAFYLVLTLGISITALMTTPAAARRRWWYAGIALLVLMLILTYTRGAWIGLGVFLVVLGCFYYRKLLIWGAIALAVLVFLFPTINRFTFDQFNLNLYRLPLIERLTDSSVEESSIDWRLRVWDEMSRHVYDRPIQGYGLGTFPSIREQYVNGFFESTEAHNDYLRLAIELGFTGVGLYLLLQLSVLIALAKRIYTHPASRERTWAIGLFGLVLAFAVMSFFDNLLQGTAIMWALWVVVAGVLNMPQWSSRPIRE